MTENITAAELLAFIERWEQLDMERVEVVDQQKEVMAEAKGRGYDTKILRKVIAIRKLSADERAEQEAVMTMYMSALGLH
jgi:uncharacterized protein (UPF0335 family)